MMTFEIYLSIAFENQSMGWSWTGVTSFMSDQIPFVRGSLWEKLRSKSFKFIKFLFVIFMMWEKVLCDLTDVRHISLLKFHLQETSIFTSVSL